MNMNRRATALLFLFLAVGYAAVTPAVTPVPPPKRRTATATRPKMAPMDKATPMKDADLEKDIRARFAKSMINSHHFQVHVQGGVATIEGQTDVLQHKGTATRLAKNAGAVKVVNKINVSQAAKDKAAKNLASGRRRAQVKRSDTTTTRTLKRSS
ncbi:MAG TPA: BON domain-containing protein [Bryobacteraceae bacterium]|nr:BON domain-containing protein [Bryobacteraceae bacterium]